MLKGGFLWANNKTASPTG